MDIPDQGGMYHLSLDIEGLGASEKEVRGKLHL